MKLRPKRIPAAVVSVVAATSLVTGCSGGTSSQEVADLFCETSHAITIHNTKELETLEILTERSSLTGKSTIFIPSATGKTRVQILMRRADGIRVSEKNQAVLVKDAQGTFLSTSPQYKVAKNLIVVIQLPYHVLESSEIVQTVKPNNPQIGAVHFYPVKETNSGYEHPLDALEGILSPGSYLSPEVNDYLLTNLSSGGILIPDISKNFINFSEVRTVTDVCSS